MPCPLTISACEVKMTKNDNHNILDLLDVVTRLEDAESSWAKPLPRGRLLVSKQGKDKLLSELIANAHGIRFDIYSSVSASYFSRLAHSMLVKQFVENKNCSFEDAIKLVYDEISERNELTGNFVLPISGLSINSDLVKYCGFTVFKHPMSRYIENSHVFKWQTFSTGLYIATPTITCKEFGKACEIGYALFEDFENIIYYMLGVKGQNTFIKIGGSACGFQGDTLHSIGVSQYCLVNNSEIVARGERNELMRPIPLDDDWFLDETNGNKLIEELYRTVSEKLKTKRNQKSLKDKILKAILWTGKSISSPKPEDALLCGVIALEILFTREERELFRSSIGSNIADSVALLLGCDVDNRIKISNEVKHLYGVRSNIVHGGKQEASKTDCEILTSYIKRVIRRLLSDDDLSSFTTTEDLFKYTERLKMKY